jgi:hypothetical protein
MSKASTNLGINKKAIIIDKKTLLKYQPELQGAYKAAYHVRAALL